ncbi:NAD(P)/FAD-dependent oxidoreductase [Sinanaerobacter chloroacetimidivorans]|uniref:NAD(P)/FAD-dependent oxidoreductase n=1 Tax=Sinanaerobacter chloroacetimidivorans TaxID=2818044 RepID=A0A8J7W4J1_9FIRM|nr:NAD(P)/FAD-dependent oxidoreductase [Sinanaerobacter chloroacetimidivorans]MBR0598820.1 NAD(P)/FAD-dependent oxidoreductase [Sinanaerobacter chloroacetimidivorans]
MSKNRAIKKEITVIGGGASGLMAAISAARTLGGDSVRIIEKNDKVGRKLLATGNGRCNFSNVKCSFPDFYSWILDEYTINFAKETLSRFDVDDTLEFFREIGILPKEEAEGRIYPYSEQASTVQESLKAEAEGLGIEILYSSSVKSVKFLDNEEGTAADGNPGFEILLDKGDLLYTRYLILAAGGKAGSQYGSTGESYQMARFFGHTIVKPIPALVPFTSEDQRFQMLKGIRAKGKVTLWKDRAVEIHAETGEIQFTDEGLSGICVLNLSRFLRLREKTDAYHDYTVRIDFFPEYSEEELHDLLHSRTEYLKNRKKEEFLNGMINKRLSPVLLKEAGWDFAGICREITSEEVKRLVMLLKSWEVEISGTKGWKEAQVTSGGICILEISAETMESKRIKGLYFAGEIIDMDGLCGGYNLQWAWTSGYIAGASAASASSSAAATAASERKG